MKLKQALLCAALLAALFAGCTQRTAPTGGDPDTPPAQNSGDTPDQPAQPAPDEPQPAPETPSGDAPQLTTPDNEDELLAVMQDGSAVLVIGFNEQNVVLMDPLTGTVYKKGMNDARSMFEENGNRFIAYS